MWKAVLQKSIKDNMKLNPTSVYFQMSNLTDEGLPTVRTVVFRGFIAEKKPKDMSHGYWTSDLIVTTTHFHSNKVKQLLENNVVEICWYFPETHEQYRLKGKAHLVADPIHNIPPPTSLEGKSYHQHLSYTPNIDPNSAAYEIPTQPPKYDWEKERMYHFNRLKPELRASFTWPPPGQPRTEPDERFIPQLHEGDTSSVLATMALQNFVLIIIEVNHVDRCVLNCFPHKRYFYKWNMGSKTWVETEVNP